MEDDRGTRRGLHVHRLRAVQDADRGGRAWPGLPAAARRVRAAVAHIAATEDSRALRAEGIDIVVGRARFTGPRQVRIDGRVINARRVVIATGAGPLLPPIAGLAATPHLTSESAFVLDRAPASLLVLGGAAVGCELAQAFSRFGTRVTLVEARDRLLPSEEADASAVIATVFTREGIDVRVGAGTSRVDHGPAGVRIELSDGTALDAERVLIAVGRVPDTAELDADRAGIALDERGHVLTDARLATTAAGVYAAGDVTGRMPFTHAAFEMGRIAAGNALSRRPRQRYSTAATPWVTFTDPEVARVGLTLDAAPARARVAYLPMNDVDRAITAGRTDGYIRLIAGPRPVLRGLGGGRLLGATIVGARAGELIHEPALAMATGMFTGRLAATTHAYPTWSVGIQQAAAQFFPPPRRPRPPAPAAGHRAGNPNATGSKRAAPSITLELLVVPRCPHRAAAEQALHRAAAIAGLPGARIDLSIIATADQARTAGFPGSPTFRIAGRDPFAEPGHLPSLSCRLYRTPAGLRPVPDQSALVAAIRQATTT